MVDVGCRMVGPTIGAAGSIEVASVDKRFVVSLPEELLAGFGWLESEVSERVREALVMDLLRLDRLSEGQAAEILDLSRSELLDTMGRYQVPAIRMGPEELQRELA